MCLQLDPGRNCNAATLRRSAEVGIGNAIAVAVRPAEVAAADTEIVDLVRRQVVAKPIAAVVGRLDRARPFVERQPHRVPQATGEDVLPGTILVHLGNCRSPGIALHTHVTARTRRDIELVICKQDCARHVLPTLRQPRDHNRACGGANTLIWRARARSSVRDVEDTAFQLMLALAVSIAMESKKGKAVKQGC